MKTKIILIIGMLSLLNLASYAGNNDKLWAACSQCDLEGVKKWVEKGADVNALNSTGGNSLSQAFFCPEVVKYLLAQGANPNGDNGNALVNAANHYSFEVMDLLLSAGADPDAKSSLYNMNPAQIILLQTNCVPCLQLLKDNGAKLDSIYADGTNYIHYLAISGLPKEQRQTNWSTIKPAYEKAGVKVPDWLFNMEPSRNGSVAEMLYVLLTAGCDINLQNGKDLGANTALMVAIGLAGKPFKPFIAEALLDMNANVKLKNTSGDNAIDIAKTAGMQEMAQRMKDMN
jgi:ankyrin repeat protein